MPIPSFIRTLRDMIGHHPLWLSGVTAVVMDGDRVLLTRRADDERWSLVSGILEPGEQPARAIVREVEEETGVKVVVERLSSVLSLPPMVVPNGDQCQFLDLCFRCRYVVGDAHVADDENLDVRWWTLAGLPDLPTSQLARIEHAVHTDGPPFFEH